VIKKQSYNRLPLSLPGWEMKQLGTTDQDSFVKEQGKDSQHVQNDQKIVISMDIRLHALLMRVKISE
jgi:hypothetical protein